MKNFNAVGAYALCFASGVAIAEASGFSFGSGPLAPVVAESAVLALAAVLLFRRSGPAFCSAAVPLLFLLVGFTHACGCILLGEFSLPRPEGMRTVQDLLESLPFRDARTAPLLEALLTGERRLLPRTLTQSFRASGASHILALSGLHLGIVYGILSVLLVPISREVGLRPFKSFLACAACAWYALATGGSPSVVRALLFVVLRETASLFPGRRLGLVEVWFEALFFQLVLQPSAICSVGFQLSYLAVLGIALIYPRLDLLWDRAVDALQERSDRAPWEEPPHGRSPRTPMRRIWQSMALSISCQITTGPLAYLRFGTFPRYFLLTNLLALPLTEALITLAAVLLFCCALFPDGALCSALVLATDRLASTLCNLLEIIAAM